MLQRCGFLAWGREGPAFHCKLERERDGESGVYGSIASLGQFLVICVWFWFLFVGVGVF